MTNRSSESSTIQMYLISVSCLDKVVNASSGHRCTVARPFVVVDCVPYRLHPHVCSRNRKTDVNVNNTLFVSSSIYQYSILG